VRTTVAILGGNSVVGRALEALLRGAGYDTRLIDEPITGMPEELLWGVELLLVAPTPSTKSRERFLDGLGSMSGTAAIPILTLYSVVRRVLADQTGLVPWPCRLEELKAEIEAARRAPSYSGAPAEAE
jgi:hypothetical protein